MKKTPFPVIAILDDDSEDQLLLRSAFEECRQGIEICFFSDYEELLTFLQSNGGYDKQENSLDLIIFDLHHAGESCLEAVEKIKSNPVLRQVPLLVLIGSLSTEIKRYYELGVNTVITRPVSFHELAGVIKKICDYWFGPLEM